MTKFVIIKPESASLELYAQSLIPPSSTPYYGVNLTNDFSIAMQFETLEEASILIEDLLDPSQGFVGGRPKRPKT